jgi:hypothetical protein
MGTWKVALPRGKRMTTRTLTQDSLLSTIGITGTTLDPTTLARNKIPLQANRDMANAVVNEETGELMEYRHLMKNPKYHDVWSNSYGNEIG